jgi:glycerol-3-phosphate O-acyltransferase/dihydroxyacetone phosphate acyltransferase
LLPEKLPLWIFVVAEIVLFPSITFAALRFGEVGMDIFKSLRPLVLSLNPTSANTLVQLRRQRETLSAEVTQLINTLGPELYPDFDATRVVADPFREGSVSASPLPSQPPPSQSPHSPTSATAPTGIGGGSSAEGHLPRNESFGNLGSIGMFATRPPSRSRSRSNSSGAPFSVHGFSSLDSEGSLDEISKKIRGAMKERGKERSRRKHSTDGSINGDIAMPEDSEDGKKHH